MDEALEIRGQKALIKYYTNNTPEACVRFVFLDTWDSTPTLNSTNNQIFHRRINVALNITTAERRTRKRETGTNNSVPGTRGALQEVFDSLAKDVRVRD